MNVSLTDSLVDGGVVVGLARKPPPSPGTQKDKMTTINTPAAIALHDGMSESDCSSGCLPNQWPQRAARGVYMTNQHVFYEKGERNGGLRTLRYGLRAQSVHLACNSMQSS